MRIAEMLLPEFDEETKGTRKVLARLPEEQFDWQPHPKSMSLGKLANHVVDMVGWGAMTLRETEFDIAPEGGAAWQLPNRTTREALLAAFDANAAETRAALAAADDADFGVPWTLRAGAQVYFTLPRATVLRSMVFNHLVHHRAQLTVYLRLLDVPVPGLYGPSADEQ
ncbi:MAG: DinB family protein [Thermoanaerobaculia bacterium]|nr:DinB family protein [Thermoanaerobaculia bacterium]